MSYLHMPVRKLVKEHEDVKALIASHISTTDQETQDRRARVEREVDGVPVHINTAAMCDLIRARHKNIRFATTRRGSSMWTDGFNIRQEMWAYFEGDEFAIMRIGYGDYGVRSSVKKFMVYSRKIHNNKFDPNRDQYFMVMADTLERAVKNANSYMYAYTVPEIANLYLDRFQSQLAYGGRNASELYSDVRGRLNRHASLVSEMQSLVDRGYVFNDPSFGACVMDMLEKYKEHQATLGLVHHGYYVNVSTQLGEQVFHVTTVNDVRTVTRIDPKGTYATLKAHELQEFDENLAQRLAALSILQDGSFVEGLGQRVDETNYWVLR